MTDPFRPVLYLKAGCPHCFKTRLFLTEAGLIDRFEVREFVPGEAGEDEIRAELQPHFAKVTFPTAQVAAGQYLNESDAIVDRYAAEAGVDPAALPLTRTWREVLLPRLQKARAENKELLARLEALSPASPESRA